MNMNNNTDSKARIKKYLQKTVKHLRWRFTP